MMPPSQQAVVLLSGGLDSATTLAIAQEQGFACHAISFDYGQRHRLELDAAKRIAARMQVMHHQVVPIDLRAFGGSALTDDIEVPKDRIAVRQENLTPDPPACARAGLSPGGSGEAENEIPITYVPARNLIFLSLALGYAEAHGIRDIFIGVNAIDYSGYPDCRPDFIVSFEHTANMATRLGIEADSNADRIRVHTPLVNMSKAQIIRRGTGLNVDYSLTTSCYDPQNGRPCHHCDSCLLRAAGFAEAGVADPALD